jgi:hypothetical protein
MVMCINAVDKLSRLWDSSDPEDRQGMARSLFNYIVFDLDSRRIVDFRLKPWADRFLVLRAALYENENGSGTPFSDTISRLEHESRYMLPEGFQTISRDYMGPTVAVILVVLNGSFITTSIRVTSSIPPKTERNQEIIHRYLAGERALDLAQEFGISVRRVNKLIVRQRKHNNL